MGELSKHKAALSVASEATNKRGNKALGFSTRESFWCFQGPGQQQGLENLSARDPFKARARPELWISLPPAFALPATKHEGSYCNWRSLIEVADNSSPNIPEPE